MSLPSHRGQSQGHACCRWHLSPGRRDEQTDKQREWGILSSEGWLEEQPIIPVKVQHWCWVWEANTSTRHLGKLFGCCTRALGRSAHFLDLDTTFTSILELPAPSIASPSHLCLAQALGLLGCRMRAAGPKHGAPSPSTSQETLTRPISLREYIFPLLTSRG